MGGARGSLWLRGAPKIHSTPDVPIYVSMLDCNIHVSVCVLIWFLDSIMIDWGLEARMVMAMGRGRGILSGGLIEWRFSIWGWRLLLNQEGRKMTDDHSREATLPGSKLCTAPAPHTFFFRRYYLPPLLHQPYRSLTLLLCVIFNQLHKFDQNQVKNLLQMCLYQGNCLPFSSVEQYIHVENVCVHIQNVSVTWKPFFKKFLNFLSS